MGKKGGLKIIELEKKDYGNPIQWFSILINCGPEAIKKYGDSMLEAYENSEKDEEFQQKISEIGIEEIVKRWFISEQHMEIIEEILDEFFEDWLYTIECGKKCGTFHFQIYGVSKERTRPCTLAKKIRKYPNGLLMESLAIQPCSTTGRNALKEYCIKSDATLVKPPRAKDKDRLKILLDKIEEKKERETWDPFADLPFNEKSFYPWQYDAYFWLTSNDVNSGEITWIIGGEGKEGKSDFTTYMWRKFKVVPIDAEKRNDIKHIASKFAMSKMMIVDISRTLGQDISMDDVFDAVENVRKGRFSSGKYDSKIIDRVKKNIIVFSNYSPNIHKLSYGRLKIYGISEDKRLICLETWTDIIKYLILTRGSEDPIIKGYIKNSSKKEEFEEYIKHINKSERYMRNEKMRMKITPTPHDTY